MWCLVSLLLLSAHQSMGWVSGGDRSDNLVLSNNKLSLSRDSGWHPLRISFDTSGSFSGTGGVSMSSYPEIGKMLKAVRAYFYDSLSINRVTQEISTDAIACGNGISLTQGIYSDTDVVIVVRGYNGGAASETGFSQVCYLQYGDVENVVVGIININIDAFNTEPDYMRKWSFIAHLTVHVLGFSEALYPYWGSSTGKIGVANIVRDITVRGLTKKAIVTPKALQKAREAYSYSTMPGIELEEPVSFANRNEHWEARVMFNDISCIRSYPEMIVSTVTLALLEDSGWYKVTGCSGQVPLFGRGLGCNFIENKCINSGKTSNHGRLWGGISKSSTCDAFNLRKGSLTVSTTLPTITNSAKNYFGNNKVGGLDEFADLCPYTIPIEGNNCRSSNLAPVAGQIFGSESRCFENSLNLATGIDVTGFSASCFEVDCKTPGDYQFTVDSVRKFKFNCPQAGGPVFVSNVAPGVNIFGWVNCPPRNQVCEDILCINNCNGQGCCTSGACSCFKGFDGKACEIVCTDYCNTCPDGPCTQCKTGFYLDGGECKPCQVGCADCTSLTSCKTPSDGFNKIVDGGSVTVVPICLDNCHDCTVPYTCGIPNDGFCFDSSGTGLNKCCNGCNKCLPNDCCYCLECKFGLMITTINTCTSECVVNCLVCKNTLQCASCKKGYNLTPDGRCLRCPDGCSNCYNYCTADMCRLSGGGIVNGCLSQDICDSQCIECADVVCTECSGGWKKNTATNKCEKICPINCNSCSTPVGSSTAVCKICNSGFYLDATVTPALCTPCEANCLKCTKVSDTVTNCQSCRAGFFLRAQLTGSVTENDCVDCETGCSYCDNELSCKTCVIRFYFDDNHCYRCEYGCRTCTKDGCITADPGFFLQVDRHVTRCHKSCATCDEDLICNTCLPGFFFYECSSFNCLCRDCEPNCAKCSSPSECIICRAWYFLDVNNRCSICDPLCASCEMAGKCISCKWGYYLKPDKTCGKCMTGCQNCVDYEHCKICLGGYWPNEYVCESCPTNCLLCWTPSDCYSCRLGWWLNKVDFLVPTCVQCDSLCVRCGSLTDCQVCKRKYFIKAGVCAACGANCAFCVSELECTICEQGFFLDIDNTCKPCQNGCIDCCDAMTCMRARNGWWLDYFPGLYTNRNAGTAIGPYIVPSDLGGYISTPCGSKCTSCITLNDCGSCQRGSYVNDAQTACVDCPKECADCASATRCFRCNPKYYLDNGICYYCGDNCNACSSTQCTTPKPGFFALIDDPRLVGACLAPCETCVNNDGNGCIKCRAGSGIIPSTASVYSSTITTYKCEPCDIGCRLCNPRNQCTAANNPYYINPDGTVSKCPDLCTSCKLDNGSIVCLTCINKYGIDNGNCVSCTDPNCAKCSPGNTCVTCGGGWFLTAQFTCIKCVSPCNACTDPTTCLNCITGFYLPNPKVPGPCSQCIPNCNRCSDSTTCDVCRTAYYYDKNKKSCEVCPGLCTACSQVPDSDGNLVVKCSSCVTKATIEGLTCVTCDDTNCVACSPRTTCTTCANGFYLVGTGCIKCTAPCGLCSSQTFCKTCIGATYLESATTGNCLNCISNCNRCLDGVTCVTCKYAFYFDLTAKACLACPTNCVACKHNPNTLVVECTGCASRFVLTGIKCDACSANCNTCTSSTTCTVCLNGFFLDGVACTKCTSPCGWCTSSSFCTSCTGSTYLIATTGVCDTCMTNCVRCINKTGCVTCRGGFYFDINLNTCVSCPPLCTSCSQNPNTFIVECLTCAGRSVKEGLLCVACSANCNSCSSSTSCTVCLNGFFLDGAVCTKCSAPCGLCTSSTFCVSCVGAFYMLSATAGTCDACLTNCFKCTDKVSCLSIRGGFYLSRPSTGPVIIQCPLGCSACIENVPGDASSVACSACYNGYFLDGTTCVKCSAPCGFCTSSTFCTTCAGAFYMQNAATGTCDACLTNCNKCTDKVSCTSIRAWFYLSNPSTGPVILQCPPACTACIENVPGDASSVTCSACRNTNYANIGGKCCINSCKVCDNSLTCAACVSGWSLNSAKLCYQCSANCDSCTSNIRCTTCLTNYWVYNNLCCPSRCATCNNLQCWTCKPTFFFKDGTCIDCPVGCDGCLNGVCQKCKKGYFMDVTTCSPCTDPQCTDCASATWCNSCASGTTSTNDGKCTSCPDKCDSCNTVACWTCKPTFFLKDGACVDCPQGCDSCLNGVCQKCKTGYYISSTTCLPCKSGCNACDSATFCSDCPTGYTSASDGSCTPTIPCPSSCETCNINRCFTCKESFYFSYGECTSCPYACDKCSNGVCQSCMVGYFINGKTCLECPIYCTECVSELTCTACQVPYQLSDTGRCVNPIQCLNGCSNCESGKCTACSKGYFMTNVGCTLCADGCAECTGVWDCKSCLPYNNLIGGYCCPIGCSSCNPGSASCWNCDAGYYLEDKKCIACRVGCLTCSNGVCDACKVGYFITNTYCTKCATGCDKCWSDVSCETCESAYTLKNGLCEPSL